ncbi:ABC transporter transmembrane domain-containing protein [Synechococcus sp. MU1648]|uniref:ABC transporter transmembrane domain-containing protein n=1 Tax=Synechococcus sp. MU1648 TaxID=2508351 RepID=UPI0020269227|nr:ABC transporter transmembrane domain-containing protein [Synechococcus sp. MU1648]
MTDIIASSSVKSYTAGQRLYGSDEIPRYISFVLSGEFRLLTYDESISRIVTLAKYGPGRLLGWSSILRGVSADYSICSTNAKVIQIPAEKFLYSYQNSDSFSSFFNSKVTEQEVLLAISAVFNTQQINQRDLAVKSSRYLPYAKLTTLSSEDSLHVSDLDPECFWYLTTGCIENLELGQKVANNNILEIKSTLSVPLRLLGLPKAIVSSNFDLNDSNSFGDTNNTANLSTLSIEHKDSTKAVIPFSLEQLGIVESEQKSIYDIYPFISGGSPSQKVLALCQMLALFHNIPFRKDSIEKVLEDYLRRDKQYSLPMLGGLLELMGYRCLVGKTNSENLLSLDFPAVVFIDQDPVIIFGLSKQKLVIANPQSSKLEERDLSELPISFGEEVKFLLPQKTDTTPEQTLNWSWFLPLVNKYRKSLALVFAASLLAQLFGLAIPLMIQQIIDKVLTQGNLNSLNLIGSAMIVFALFQGVLVALRSYIFVDTTDRMDLTLGSTVIQRLLSLPLSYFDKRPVGELSQRLGELNTIRGFLTGTALVSSLNIIFALIYLVVMFLYSPILSLIALSTIPLYIIVVLVISPIFKSLIRKRAVAQAKTQSHLIEVLNGIQTVKAQHFELTARWRWQDKYRHFVDEGFKSSVIGVASGEIGKFLNTISSLLVLWYGMWLVLDGKLTLGMLIAFRIISGNVTGPLLQLSGLYQSFQGVQLSMERLSDVIDQKPELDTTSAEVGKIILPPIQGHIEFRDVYFRFKPNGPYQVDGVNITVEKGNFVGVVGQSGSGKSTLMKLVPKLYNPEKGQILVDGYDIDKVDLASLRRQVGIVPQDSILFEGSIAENIALNDPNASTDSIINAAKIACAHDFIMELDEGYSTQLSERGSNLSGGQRQRVAVARTILADPQLLIMDEATSALDFNTERQLCENLYNWADNKTVFFITHRLSTIKSSDVIIVMNKGSVVETGIHDDLMSSRGRYFALYQQQQIGS